MRLGRRQRDPVVLLVLFVGQPALGRGAAHHTLPLLTDVVVPDAWRLHLRLVVHQLLPQRPLFLVPHVVLNVLVKHVQL